jgi:hypothetical protein
MKFTPKTEAELKAEKVLPKGEYDVEIVGCEEQVSKKSGKDMLKLTLKVHGPEKAVLANDYIVCDQQDKLHNLCTSIGIVDKYARGEVGPIELANQWAYAKVDVESNDTYGDKNVIKKYVVKKLDKAATTVAGIQKFEQERKQLAGAAEDDSPF